MTALDLATILRRAESIKTWKAAFATEPVPHIVDVDVPALVKEVMRLREQLALSTPSQAEVERLSGEVDRLKLASIAEVRATDTLRKELEDRDDLETIHADMRRVAAAMRDALREHAAEHATAALAAFGEHAEQAIAVTTSVPPVRLSDERADRLVADLKDGAE